MKAILIIADGLGGRSTDYNGRTCLEAADTPNLDRLATIGINGLLDPIKPGVRPGSDTAHLSIFGYDPERIYTGRGVFEALGIGMEVKDGDICFRANLATVDNNLKVIDRRAGRINEGLKEIEEAINSIEIKDVKIIYRSSVEHRGALILRGGNLSHNITDADPHKVGLKVEKVKALTDDESARRTAEIVNEFIQRSHQILKNLPVNKRRERERKPPANIVLLRGASIKPKIKSLREIYGIEGSAIAGGALYLGIAKAIGLKTIKPEGATGRKDSDLISKVKAALEELDKGKDFVFIHFKGADSCAHDHDAKSKIEFIEKIDQALGYLLENVDLDDFHIAFTGDHSTPIEFGDHTADPVPIIIAGRNVTPDDVKRFSERSAMKGGLGRISGRVIPILFGYCDWLEKFGA